MLNHILLSYQKHHDPSHQPIKEDTEQHDIVNVIRPLPGIEQCKYQPMVRQISNIKVALTPCKISPITKRIFKEVGPANVKEPEVEVVIQDQLKPEPPPVYSEDFYEGFVKRMFEENPQIDKRQLVSKILSHL